LKNTAEAVSAAGEPPKYQRRQKVWIVDEISPRIRELLHCYPRTPTTVVIAVGAPIWPTTPRRQSSTLDGPKNLDTSDPVVITWPAGSVS
jgi:hypothetical protein